MKNMYDILGISRQATAGEIKSAYKRRSLETHPDRNGGDKTKQLEFGHVQEAYKILGNTAKRVAYDAELHAATEAAERTARSAARARAEAQARAQRAAPISTPRRESGTDAGTAVAVGAGILFFGGLLAAILSGGSESESRDTQRSGGGRAYGGSRARWDPYAQRYRGDDGKFRPG